VAGGERWPRWLKRWQHGGNGGNGGKLTWLLFLVAIGGKIRAQLQVQARCWIKTFGGVFYVFLTAGNAESAEGMWVCVKQGWMWVCEDFWETGWY
jgi:hypothetical protein